MRKYYIHDDQEQRGPFDFAELKNKQIKKTTLVWYEGLDEWEKAETLDELKELFAIVPPPFKESEIPLESNTKNPPNISTNKKDSKRKYIVGFVSLITLAIIIAALFIFIKNKSSNKSYSRAPLDNSANERNAKEIAIKDSIAAVEMAINETQNKEIAKQQEQAAKKKKEIQKKKIRNNWSSYINATRSSYSYRNIGGISDLYITVTNNTDYLIEVVTAEISYIKSNGDVYKTESVIFTNIEPNTWKKMKAPDSNRGTSVDYLTITEITSTDLNFCYTPGSWANNSPDPYKCK